jgi:hypothetical protein
MSPAIIAVARTPAADAMLMTLLTACSVLIALVASLVAAVI